MAPEAGAPQELRFRRAQRKDSRGVGFDKTSSVQQSEWGEFIKEQMENCVCVCCRVLK